MSRQGPWTDERDDELRAAWAAGTSAKDIARSMGCFDHTADGGKGAVLGRSRRLGLTPRANGNRLLDPAEAERRRVEHDRKRTERKRRRRTEGSAPTRGKVPKPKADRTAPVKAPAPVAPPYEPVGISFGDLRPLSSTHANQCRKIDINDLGPNYLYCGSDTPPGQSYCTHCEKICRGETRKIVVMTEAQREERRLQGLRAGYTSLRSRGRVMGRAVATATAPVLDIEARV